MSDFTPHEAPIHEAQGLPVMLTGKLVGRDAALAQVYSQLKEGRPVLVHGPAGSGKTALAAGLARAYTQQPGGVLWLRVANPRLEELLARVGRAYQINEITSSENLLAMVGAVENTLKQHKPFIVLDGAIQPDVASRFISRCIDNLPLLITGEAKIEGGWGALELEALEADHAAALFKQEARLTTDDQDINVYGIVKLVSYNPFGIVVAARAMLASKKAPDEFLESLRQIAQSAGGNNPTVAVTSSFRALNGALQGLLLMMGATFNGAASAGLLSMISGAPLESVQQAMNILSQLNLVERTRRYGNFYYRLHPITYAFARAGLRGSDRLVGLQNKVRDTVLEYAKARLEPSTANHNDLAMEMDTFIATARWAAENDQRGVAGELVTALSQSGDFIDERGYLYELMLLRELSTGASTAFPAYPREEMPFPVEDDGDDEYAVDEDALESVEDDDDDLDFEDDDLDDLDDDDSDELPTLPEDEDLEGGEHDQPVIPAASEATLENQDISQLRAALAQVRAEGDQARQLEILKSIGQIQISQQMQNEAIATYSDILALFEEMDDENSVLETLDMLSALMAATENSQAAVLHATRGIKLAEELEEDETQMHLLITLGDARQQLGESATAAGDYNRALTIARTRDDSQNEAMILFKLGYAQLDDSQPEAAVDTWEQALTLFKAQEKRGYEGRILGGLGSAYGDMDRWAEAVSFHTSALHIAREIGDKDEEALQLSGLAHAATQAGQLGEAVLRYRQALHLAYEADNRDNIVSNIVDLCRLLLKSRKHVSVAELLIQEAIDLEPNDKDVVQLEERINSERMLAESYGTNMIPITGTVRDYAANAYELLEA